MPTFIDLGDLTVNLDAIAYVQWGSKFKKGSVVLALLSSVEEGEGETISFEIDSPEAQRLREAFKQVPHIPVMGAHAKAID